MRVEIEHITKTFGPLRANDAISMTFEGGRIYAILGENGAGKSTLMKILSGYQPPDSGRVLLDGAPASFQTPADALAVGIGMLHQEPLDVPNLTALENFMLGRREGIIPRRHEARARFQEQAGRLGFTLNPDAYVDTMTIGERQQLEIVRLLSFDARVLILDEPTTGISAEQKTTLFESLKRLAAESGLTVILVSHKLEDVEALCDEVYVLRQGRVIGNRTMPCSTAELVALMFGGDIERTPRPPLPRHEVVLSVRNLSISARRMAVRGLSLDVCAGEVIGLAGLDGSGQREFLRACAGLQDIIGGQILLAGQPVTRRPYHALSRLGVAYASAGRLEEGLVPGLTLAEHFALVTPGRMWIDFQGIRKLTEARIAHYNIRGRPESEIQTLSGGNQQRTLIALLPPELRLLLLEDPTRGLDVESTIWVWRQLLDRRTHGTAIMFLSPDLDEIVEYSDRIIVFFGGKATLVEDSAHMTVDRLGLLIGGKS